MESTRMSAGARFPALAWSTVPGEQLVPSEERSPQETNRPFAEAGLFVINPAGVVQAVDISNAPFARPDLKSPLQGIRFVMAKNYSIRGRA